MRSEFLAVNIRDDAQANAASGSCLRDGVRELFYGRRCSSDSSDALKESRHSLLHAIVCRLTGSHTPKFYRSSF